MKRNLPRRDAIKTIVSNISLIDFPTVKAVAKNLSRKVVRVVSGRSGPSAASELSQQQNEVRMNKALENFEKSQMGSSHSVTTPKTQRPASDVQRLNLRDLDERPPRDGRCR